MEICPKNNIKWEPDKKKLFVWGAGGDLEGAAAPANFNCIREQSLLLKIFKFYTCFVHSVGMLSWVIFYYYITITPFMQNLSLIPVLVKRYCNLSCMGRG